jgi:hypothetical protein
MHYLLLVNPTDTSMTLGVQTFSPLIAGLIGGMCAQHWYIYIMYVQVGSLQMYITPQAYFY